MNKNIATELNQQRFGERVLVIDSTHNTTHYGCKLITISVVNPENNRGYPSVFCITSHENSKALSALWKVLKVTAKYN